MGTCPTGFGSPSQLQDSKVPMLSGTGMLCAAKLLTQQEHGTSPWQGLSSHRGAEPSFPSSSPALGDAEHHGGLSRFRSTPVVLHFQEWSVHPPPSFSERAEGQPNFSCALSSGSGVPKTQGGTYNTCAAQQRAKWGILFDFFVPHKTALLPSKMRPQESCAEHPLSPPLPVVLSSSTVSLALSTVSARAQPIGREKYGMRRLCRS